MTPNKKATFFNVIPSPRDDRDVNADLLFDDVFKCPKTLDWTNHLQPVRNQGVQGTSLTQVGACMLEWKSRKLNKESIKLSPQFIFNQRKDKTDQMMCGRELMKLMTEVGTCSEKLCPYGSLKNPIVDTDRQFKIKGYARVRTINTLKMALNVVGPCLITFPVFNHTAFMWKQHKEEEILGGHALAVIGYNSTGFILRNSWGKYWEKKGHCIYPYSDWGYHEEIWCNADELAFDHYKTKPGMLCKLFSKKKSPYSTESRAVSNDKEFFIPGMLELPEQNDLPLASQFKTKDIVKTEKNEMIKKPTILSTLFVPVTIEKSQEISVEIPVEQTSIVPELGEMEIPAELPISFEPVVVDEPVIEVDEPVLDEPVLNEPVVDE
jgi:hypothetical protein